MGSVFKRQEKARLSIYITAKVVIRSPFRRRMIVNFENGKQIPLTEFLS